MSLSDTITAFNGFIGTMSNVMNKTKNIGYVSNKNLTTIAGITNCEALGVLGKPVALKEDLNGKANTSHTHDIDDVIWTYEEEEEYWESVDDGEDENSGEGRWRYRTITKTKTLSNILDAKASSNHNHNSTYAALSHSHAISDITNLQTSLDNKLAANKLVSTTYGSSSNLKSIFNFAARNSLQILQDLFED